jgi:Na+-translocating ferredoxin:NAD+ oxidoreductase RnfD subunit
MTLTVVTPRAADPRLKVGLAVSALQILGLTGLSFKVSIVQIVVPVALCGLADVAWSAWRRREIAWPASGVLAGNSIAFILRASGTHHGDWWTTHGIALFAAAAGIAVTSKYVIRVGGHHVFNPSNVAIVVVLLAAGVGRAFPQYLWWGRMNWALALAWVVIFAGGFVVLRQLAMLPMALAYLATLWAGFGALALAGRSFFARWSDAALLGASYWRAVALSPEVFVFAFFMLTDPQTAPRSPRARVVYGVSVAALAALLAAPQTTEFGVKLAIFSALVAVCAAMALARRASIRPKLVVTCIALVVAGLTIRTAYDAHVVAVEHPPPGSSGTANQ